MEVLLLWVLVAAAVGWAGFFCWRWVRMSRQWAANEAMQRELADELVALQRERARKTYEQRNFRGTWYTDKDYE